MLWSHHEPCRGQREYREWDADYPVSVLHAAGFRLKSHVSVWFWHGYYPAQWGVFMPAWVYGLDAPEVLRAVYQHQRALVERYREHVAGFQAINEPMLSHTNGPNLSLRETIEAVRQSAQAIRDGGSEGPIEVNNCCVFAETVNADVREQGYERMPCEFFEDLAAAGVDFDEVGIQLYYGGYMCSDLFSGGFAVRHLLDLSELIDRYGLVGRPVNVSEVSVPSSPPPENGPYVGEWLGPWSPERQAAWVKALYTLCYSKRCVQEVSWWNATDEGAFIHSGGLMTAAYEPKPAYYMLRSLINGWKAAGEADCDPSGKADLKGPAGTYQVMVDYGGQQYGPLTVHWGPDDNEAEVTLRRGPAN
jgi:GH35 family endo-1,4-beta-xylanase